jgi:hypothetical protein
MRFRQVLTSTRGVPRAIAALLSQIGNARGTGLISEGGLAVTADATKFKTARKLYYSIAKIVYSKAATDNLTFSAAHTVTAQKFGAVLVQLNAAGTFSTKVVASPQAYDTLAEAIAHRPAADSGKAIVGIFVIQADRATAGLVVDGNLAISATAEKFKTTQTARYSISSVVYELEATDLLTFTAAHVVAASKFGVILVQVNAAGTVSTRVPGATQSYNDAPTALAALPAADAGNVALGYIAIAADAGGWTANTDDMTNASDLTTASFNDATESGAHDFVANTDDLSLVSLTIQERRAI